MRYFDHIAPAYSALSRYSPWLLVRKMEEKRIFQSIRLDDFASMLDVGCGSGHYMKAAIERNPRIAVFGCDPSPAMAAECKRSGYQVFRGPIECFPEQRTFDLVLCAGVLEFLGEPSLFFRKSRKVISPFGKLVVFFPERNCWGLLYLLFHKMLGNKVFLHRGDHYVTMAKESGFELEFDSGLSATGRVIAWVPSERLVREC